MKRIFAVAAVTFVITAMQPSFAKAEPPWRALSLAADGKVDAAWKQIGGGRFVVDDGTLPGESDETGMGMLLYSKEFPGAEILGCWLPMLLYWFGPSWPVCF